MRDARRKFFEHTFSSLNANVLRDRRGGLELGLDLASASTDDGTGEPDDALASSAAGDRSKIQQ